MVTHKLTRGKIWSDTKLNEKDLCRENKELMRSFFFIIAALTYL